MKTKLTKLDQKVLDALKKYPKLSLTAIAKKLKMTKNSFSYHVSVLRQKKVIK